MRAELSWQVCDNACSGLRIVIDPTIKPPGVVFSGDSTAESS